MFLNVESRTDRQHATTRHRLSVNLNDETAELLERLMAAQHASVTEVVRHSIVIHSHLRDEQSQGRVTTIADPDGGNAYTVHLL